MEDTKVKRKDCKKCNGTGLIGVRKGIIGSMACIYCEID